MLYVHGYRQHDYEKFPTLILNGDTGVRFNFEITGRNGPFDKELEGVKKINKALAAIKGSLGGRQR